MIVVTASTMTLLLWPPTTRDDEIRPVLTVAEVLRSNNDADAKAV
jgi:hypothetical protein